MKNYYSHRQLGSFVSRATFHSQVSCGRIFIIPERPFKRLAYKYPKIFSDLLSKIRVIKELNVYVNDSFCSWQIKWVSLLNISAIKKIFDSNKWLVSPLPYRGKKMERDTKK